jgi:hypothetical protein
MKTLTARPFFQMVLKRRAQRGFALFQATLVMAMVALCVGLWVQAGGEDRQVEALQRQAGTLNVARLAGQRLVAIYRNQLVADLSAMSSQPANLYLSIASDGSLLSTPLQSDTISSPANNTTTVKWRFTGQDLITLKLLDSNFPKTGLYGSLAGASLQLDLTAKLTPASAGKPAQNQIQGTLCYTRPLLRDGVPDGAALAALISQVSRKGSVVGTGGGKGISSTIDSGALAISLGADPANLQWSGGSTPVPKDPVNDVPSAITPAAGLVCALVGDWGGVESTGRNALSTANPGDTCGHPNTLAWMASADAAPRQILWCSGGKWSLFMGAKEGDGCTQGQIAFNSNDLSILVCDPGGTPDKLNKFVQGYVITTQPGRVSTTTGNAIYINPGTGRANFADGNGKFIAGWPTKGQALAALDVTVGDACTTKDQLGFSPRYDNGIAAPSEFMKRGRPLLCLPNPNTSSSSPLVWTRLPGSQPTDCWVC